MKSSTTDLSNVPVLEYYGMDDPPEGPNWITKKCPFHDDKNASARSNGKGFLCNACGVQGDAIRLIEEREGLGYLDSVAFYAQLSGEEYTALSKQTIGRRRPSLDSISEGPRGYERDSGVFSSRFSSRSSTRKRPRLPGG